MKSYRSLKGLPQHLGLSAQTTAWVVWWALMAAAALLALAGLRMGADAQARAVAMAVQRQQVVPLQPVPVAPPATQDFAAALGSMPQPSRFLAALDRAAADAGVSVTSVVVSEQAATVAGLGRLQFAVVIKGSYAGNKQVLAELLARFGGAGVQSLRLRVDPATQAVETTATVSLWAAPLR